MPRLGLGFGFWPAPCEHDTVQACGERVVLAAGDTGEVATHLTATHFLRHQHTRLHTIEPELALPALA